MRTYVLKSPSQRQQAAPAPVAPAESFPKPSVKRLSVGQVQRLCILARQAWNALKAEAQIPAGQNFEDWRHEQQAEACGVGSLKLATAAHYKDLEARFLNLMGDVGPAFTAAMQSGGTRVDQDLPLAKIDEAARAAGLQPGYVIAIAWGKFRTRDLRSLTVKQLWHLFYTIKNRSSAKRDVGDSQQRNKKQTAEAHAKRRATSPAEAPTPRQPVCDPAALGEDLPEDWPF